MKYVVLEYMVNVNVMVPTAQSAFILCATFTVMAESID